MQSEIDALKANKTWILTTPPAAHIFGSKWVCKVKFKADGAIDKYKEHLVAKGLTLKQALGYFETFAPVVKMSTVQILLAIAAAKQWPLHQMDVSNAFLNGYLHKTVFMAPPPGYSSSKPLVCELPKSLYGLKQASTR